MDGLKDRLTFFWMSAISLHLSVPFLFLYVLIYIYLVHYQVIKHNRKWKTTRPWYIQTDRWTHKYTDVEEINQPIKNTHTKIYTKTNLHVHTWRNKNRWTYTDTTTYTDGQIITHTPCHTHRQALTQTGQSSGQARDSKCDHPAINIWVDMLATSWDRIFRQNLHNFSVR